MYFKSFPQMLYLAADPVHGQPEQWVSMTDITRNVRFKKALLDNILNYDWYFIREGDTMESTAERLYGSPHYHWILMLLNDMYDYRNDFPLDQYQLDNYISEKYGSIETAKGTISHYIDSKGFVVDPDHLNYSGTLDAMSVSIYDKESGLNDSKRRIKIISKDLIPVVLANFRALV